MAEGFEVGDDLRRSVERRLLYALSRFGPGVERVAVRLSDVANPMGGVDRVCRIRAWLRWHESIRVETMDGPLAIDRAVRRLAARVEWTLVNGRAEKDLPGTLPAGPARTGRAAARKRKPPG